MPYTRLSEIDLARAMNIPAGPALRAEMRTYNAGAGPWSYQPTRDSTADIVAAKTPLLGAMPPADWTQIARQVRTACKRGQHQIDANLLVSRILFASAREFSWAAVQEPMGSLSVGFGEHVRYWSDVVLEDKNGLFIPFIDHRRSRGLTRPEVRRIVFSMQHIGVRERNPDLSQARLAIIRFPPSGSERGFAVHFHDGTDLLTYEDLDARVRDVYATWAQVCDERDAEKKSGTGGGGGGWFP